MTIHLLSTALSRPILCGTVMLVPIRETVCGTVMVVFPAVTPLGGRSWEEL